MVDDILTINLCGKESVISNSITNSFIKSKRLELGPKKCSRIHIGKKKLNCPELKVHNKTMKNSTLEKYIGDFISQKVSNEENIKSRKGKAFGLAGDIIAILDEVPFGNHHIEAGITMRNSMFVGGILTNSFGIRKGR